MARDLFIVPTFSPTPISARLGAGNTTAYNYNNLDNGKLVKLVAESRYDFCQLGDQIEAVVASVESAPQNGYTVGSIVTDDAMIYAVADGLIATPGVGVINVGDYVVAGAPAALNTAMVGGFPSVCSTTAAPSSLVYKWRVVSLGTGAGAVGSTIVIMSM